MPGQDAVRPAIQSVPCHRMADVGHVYTNLMGAAGAGRAGHQAVACADTQYVVPGQTVFAVLPYTAADDGIAAACDRGFYLAGA